MKQHRTTRDHPLILKLTFRIAFGSIIVADDFKFNLLDQVVEGRNYVLVLWTGMLDGPIVFLVWQII